MRWWIKHALQENNWEEIMQTKELRSEIIAHKGVAYYAERLANQIFEENARSNEWYNLLLNRTVERLGISRLDKNLGKIAREACLKEMIPTLLPAAKIAMAQALASPNISPQEKVEIYEAYILDSSIPLHKERSGVLIT